MARRIIKKQESKKTITKDKLVKKNIRGKKNTVKKELAVPVQQEHSEKPAVEINIEEELRYRQGEQEREIQYLKIEKEKKVIMWVGISFFMIVIGIMWFFNMKSVFNRVEAVNEDDFNWSKVTDDIGSSLNQISEIYNEAKNVGIGTTTEDVSQEEDIEILKLKLKELEDKLENSTPTGDK